MKKNIQKNRNIRMSVLKGEPLDGTGRVCIHLFIRDEKGPFVEPHVLHPVIEDGVQVKQKVDIKPSRGRLACDPKRSATPVTRGNVTTITMRTDDPQAVTCPACKKSKDYAEYMTRLEEIAS